MKRGVGLFGLISNINNVQQCFSKSTYPTFKLSHSDDRLWPQAFQNDQPKFEMLRNEISQLVSLVIQSHPLLRQSHVPFLLEQKFFVLFKWFIKYVYIIVYAHVSLSDKNIMSA